MSRELRLSHVLFVAVAVAITAARAGSLGAGISSNLPTKREDIQVKDVALVTQDTIRAAWAGSSRADSLFPLLHVHLCLGCPDPNVEGSLGMMICG